jgi:hypothetical protein
LTFLNFAREIGEVLQLHSPNGQGGPPGQIYQNRGGLLAAALYVRAGQFVAGSKPVLIAI